MGRAVAERQRPVADLQINFRQLAPSRKAPAIGDVFAVLPPDVLYLFGRVIAVDAAAHSFGPLVLVYLFRFRNAINDPPDRQHLQTSDLLVPPIMTNRLPWSRGYFQTVGNLQLGPGEVLSVNCFGDLRGRYYDEYNRQLPGPVGLVGLHAVHSYRTIDDEVSRALGIQLAPAGEE